MLSSNLTTCPLPLLCGKMATSKSPFPELQEIFPLNTVDSGREHNQPDEHTAAVMHAMHVVFFSYLIVVTSQFWNEANVFRSDSLHSTLNGYGGFVFLLLTSARPLGSIIVDQLSHPVSKSDLNITIEGSYWKELDRHGGESKGRERRE